MGTSGPNRRGPTHAPGGGVRHDRDEAGPQPGTGASPRDRGGRARGRTLGGTRREGGGRSGCRRRHAGNDRTVSMHGTVVIGEGEKDRAPMLYNGEAVGNGGGPAVDVAVDPIDGTRLTATGQPNALAVIALAERGSMFFPGAAVYMEKVAAGQEAADVIDVTASPEENVRLVAKAKGVRPEEIGVVILDRDRHKEIIARVREAGARAFLITDGDVAGAIATARPSSGIDLLLGIGGTPEGVIAAAALKCLGGAIQGRLSPRDDEERRKLA